MEILAVFVGIFGPKSNVIRILAAYQYVGPSVAFTGFLIITYQDV